MSVCLSVSLSVNKTSQNEWTDSAVIVHAGINYTKEELIDFWGSRHILLRKNNYPPPLSGFG